jgi:hypothetical protein
MFGRSYKERTYYNAYELGLTNEELLISDEDEPLEQDLIDESVDEVEEDHYSEHYRRY